MKAAIVDIEREMEERVAYFKSKDKLIEAQRIRERTPYDIEMLQEIGFCKGIENYSRVLSGRAPGGAAFLRCWTISPMIFFICGRSRM